MKRMIMAVAALAMASGFVWIAEGKQKENFSPQKVLDRILVEADKPKGFEVTLNYVPEDEKDVYSILQVKDGKNVGGIFVSNKFSKLLGGDECKWAAVLSHEAAHLINKNLVTGDAALARINELEADRYAMLYLVRADYKLACYRITWEFIGNEMQWNTNPRFKERLDAIKVEENDLRYLNVKFSLAKSDIALGQYENAIVLLENIKQKFPRSVSVLNNLVVANLGKYQASNYPKKLAPVDPFSNDARKMLTPALIWGLPITKTWELEQALGFGFSGFSGLVPKELKEAESLTEQVLEMDPGNLNAKINRLTVEAFITRRFNKNLEAASRAADALQAVPAGSREELSDVIDNNLALFYYEFRNDTSRAVALLRESIKKGGGNFAGFNIGMIGIFDKNAGINKPEAIAYLESFSRGTWYSQALANLTDAVIDRDVSKLHAEKTEKVVEKIALDLKKELKEEMAYGMGKETEITKEYTIARLPDGTVLLTYSGKEGGEVTGSARLSPERTKELIRILNNHIEIPPGFSLDDKKENKKPNKPPVEKPYKILQTPGGPRMCFPNAGFCLGVGVDGEPWSDVFFCRH